jgi:hypothetical protein
MYYLRTSIFNIQYSIFNILVGSNSTQTMKKNRRRTPLLWPRLPGRLSDPQCTGRRVAPRTWYLLFDKNSTKHKPFPTYKINSHLNDVCGPFFPTIHRNIVISLVDSTPIACRMTAMDKHHYTIMDLIFHHERKFKVTVIMSLLSTNQMSARFGFRSNRICALFDPRCLLRRWVGSDRSLWL